MDLLEFFATTDGLVDSPSSSEEISPRCERRPTAFSMLKLSTARRRSAYNQEARQKPPTGFLDFVNLGKTKPLTELTRGEASWPVLFGEGYG